MSTRRSAITSPDELNRLIAEAKVWFDELTPDEQKAHLREQAKSWARQDKD